MSCEGNCACKTAGEAKEIDMDKKECVNPNCECSGNCVCENGVCKCTVVNGVPEVSDSDAEEDESEEEEASHGDACCKA